MRKVNPLIPSLLGLTLLVTTSLPLSSSGRSESFPQTTEEKVNYVKTFLRNKGAVRAERGRMKGRRFSRAFSALLYLNQGERDEIKSMSPKELRERGGKKFWRFRMDLQNMHV